MINLGNMRKMISHPENIKAVYDKLKYLKTDLEWVN